MMHAGGGQTLQCTEHGNIRSCWPAGGLVMGLQGWQTVDCQAQQLPAMWCILVQCGAWSMAHQVLVGCQGVADERHIGRAGAGQAGVLGSCWHSCPPALLAGRPARRAALRCWPCALPWRCTATCPVTCSSVRTEHDMQAWKHGLSILQLGSKRLESWAHLQGHDKLQLPLLLQASGSYTVPVPP